MTTTALEIERALQQKQYQLGDEMYKAGSGVGGLKSTEAVSARVAYEASVEVLVNLLGAEVCCSRVDSNLWSHFSDWHKDVRGFRPKSSYTVTEVNHWIERQASQPVA